MGKKYREAAVLYQWSGDSLKALDSYVKSGDWQNAFSMCKELKMDQNDTQTVGYKLSQILTDRKDYSAASKVFLSFCQVLLL